MCQRLRIDLFSGQPGVCHSCHSFGLYPDEPLPLYGETHTQQLQGLFAPSTQNSSLRGLSKVDSVAHRQHYCGGLKSLQFWRRQALGSQDVARSFWKWTALSSSELLGAPNSE